MNAKLNSCYITSWDNAFSIGHEKIDTEHKKLFDIANTIYKCTNEEELTRIVKELIKYTKFHFKNEENFMQSINFKNLAYHKVLHKKLVLSLDDVIKNLKNKDIDESISHLSELVNKNILQHILIEDKKVHHEIRTRDELKSVFKWKLDYRLNNSLLDDEHEKLFEIALQALDYNNTDIRTHVKITIAKLYEYMKNHFEHEEKYMLEIEYPKYKEHKEFHNQIILQMNSFIKQLPILKIVEFEKKLIAYMDIWLINHILYEDKKIMKFIES